MADSIAASAVRLSTSDHVSLSSTLIFLSRLSRLNPNGVVDLHIISYMIISYHIISYHIISYLHFIYLHISSCSCDLFRIRMVLKKSEIQFLRHETHETEQNEQTLHLRDPVRSKALKAWEIFIGHLQIQRISTRKRTAVEHGGAVKAAPGCAFWFRSFNSCSSFCTLLWSARRKVSS